LKQAVRWGLVPRNVTEAVNIPKLVREEVNALSPEEARRFLATARRDRLEALYVLAVHCELRRGELLGLRWPDVDLDAKTLRVSRQLQRMREGGGLVFSEPKNASRRTVDLPKRAVEALRSHRKRQLEEQLRAGSNWQDYGLIFASGKGTPLDAQNIVNRQFKPLL
jgi:integrase